MKRKLFKTRFLITFILLVKQQEKNLTIEDVTQLIDEHLQKTKTAPFEAECEYCGEEMKDNSDLEKHINLFHAVKKMLM